MKKSKMSWTVQRLIKEVKNGGAKFDYPIQRAKGQWDSLQRSLLIHSVACDYPVPALYALLENVDVAEGEKPKTYFSFLDGKQRSTNLFEFINGEYRLDKAVPPFKINGVEHEFANFSFEELPADIQDTILEFSLDIVKIDEADEEEVEDLFFRLNNGTPLSQVQKAKAKMGALSAEKIQSLASHDLMKNNAIFTPLQIRKADDEVALLQSMMLLDENHKLGKFGNAEVFDYASSLRESDSKVFEVTYNTFEYLANALEDNQEKILLKKLHFPFVVYASNVAMNNGIKNEDFVLWLNDFRNRIIDKTNGEMLNGAKNENAWLYKLGCGAGATKAEKVAERLQATKMLIEEFVAKYKGKVVEPKKASQEPKQEPKQETKQEVKQEVKQEPKDVVKPLQVPKQEDGKATTQTNKEQTQAPKEPKQENAEPKVVNK